MCFSLLSRVSVQTKKEDKENMNVNNVNNDNNNEASDNTMNEQGSNSSDSITQQEEVETLEVSIDASSNFRSCQMNEMRPISLQRVMRDNLYNMSSTNPYHSYRNNQRYLMNGRNLANTYQLNCTASGNQDISGLGCNNFLEIDHHRSRIDSCSKRQRSQQLGDILDEALAIANDLQSIMMEQP